RFAALEVAEDWPRLRGTPRPEALAAPLDSLPGVGPQVKRRLARLGLATVGDLLEHRPRRYEAAVPERAIADLLGGEEVAISAEVKRVSVRRPSRRLSIIRAVVGDGTAEI